MSLNSIYFLAVYVAALNYEHRQKMGLNAVNTEWIQSVWKLDRLNCSEEDKGEDGEVCLHSLQSQFDQYYWKSRGKETARVPHYKRENADTITSRGKM